VTVAVAWPPSWKKATTTLLPITIAAGAPVHAVTIDFIGDGQPAFYFVPSEGRGTITYPITPVRSGRYEVTIAVVDERGCEGTYGTRTFVTIAP
jgi:hypothetical protein